MASSDKTPDPMPGGDGSVPPGKPTTVTQSLLGKGAQMMQTLNPIKQMSQHVCSFACYSHDMSRQIETHHYVTRLNNDFLQCAVYDSDQPNARLIGVEYIISARILETLLPEEQKLWHSHAHEITSGLWANPRVPEMVNSGELQDLVNTYGKFWCTWQTDRGDRLPLGAPALMMSPQEAELGIIKIDLVKKRDDKYKMSTDALKKSRASLVLPESMNRMADYWKHAGKGFAMDVEETQMKTTAPFP
ncbi:hypothetical protein ACET3Z_010888 [Daucus carota]